MAKLVTRYICPVCKKAGYTQAEAIRCRNSHPPIEELWAEGHGGKACLVAYFGEERALFEADLPDDITKRKQRIAELLKNDPERLRRLGYTLNS